MGLGGALRFQLRWEKETWPGCSATNSVCCGWKSEGRRIYRTNECFAKILGGGEKKTNNKLFVHFIIPVRLSHFTQCLITFEGCNLFLFIFLLVAA